MMDSEQSIPYTDTDTDLESNHYHILIETHSEDDTQVRILSNPEEDIVLEENTCFSNNKYYSMYLGIISIFVICIMVVYLIWG